jgi:retinol-binding protein 3
MMKGEKTPRIVHRPMKHASPSVLVSIVLLACSRDRPTPPPPPSTLTSASAATSAAALGTLTPEGRQRLLDAMFPLIGAHYVSPDLGASTVQTLRDHLTRGDYASVSVEDDFARRLTDDVRAVTHDLHFRVRYRAPGTPDGMTPERRAELEVEARHGIHSVERLANGVALLKLDSFLEPPDSQALRNAYASAMREVADARVLVLDLRDNYGGDPTTVAFAMSYLFDPTPVHLNDIWSRDEDVTWQNWTRRDLPGPRFGGHKPVFVLVSRQTISGGEEAAYDLQAQKRAIVVGERTAGAANPSPRFDLGDGFAIFIPSARAINPITHTNWEGTGVQPDVTVDAADAETMALSLAADAG